ncbi:MAG TPA: hypothetical protein PLK94_14460 [Alphaproteobacteria bacterium]|nr:hypothetical protein [Alphaproteobacteria bacterium]
MRRKKMSLVLFENGSHALFECYGQSPFETAAKVRECFKEAAEIYISDRYGGNGTAQRLRNEWLRQFYKHLLEGVND